MLDFLFGSGKKGNPGASVKKMPNSGAKSQHSLNSSAASILPAKTRLSNTDGTMRRLIFRQPNELRKRVVRDEAVNHIKQLLRYLLVAIPFI